MVISHSKKFIFVHNYKVAGTSMRQALRKYDSKSFLKSPINQKLQFIFFTYPWIFSNQFEGHITAQELSTKLPKQIFNNYYKFGFVRNPWDWQVSLYNYMLNDTGHYQHQLAKSFGNFENYLDWRVTKELRFQKKFFYNDNDEMLVDHIGKIENISEEIAFLSQKLNLKLELPHLKKNRPQNSFLEFYTPNTIEIVSEAFKEDISIFGYSKPEL